jgi:SAM-dependent methyltransferase
VRGVAAPDPPLDTWLTSLFGAQLDPIEAACAGAGPEAFERFRGLDDDLWALLLTREYSCYPNIRALLPEVPEVSLQESWNGSSGLDLLSQSKAFYRHVRERYAAEGHDIGSATVLDFGCGWGRLTRFFARDVAPGSLLGCDPVEEILDVCRRSRVPAELARSEFVPERLPFDRGVDLAFSFSVFTHISEGAARSCLEALHAGLNPGGLLVLTIRPPAYLDFDPKMHSVRDELGPDPVAAMREPRYVFVPHPTEAGHPQYEGGEMTYGESVISLPWIRDRWGDIFELVDVKAFPEDIYQVAITLRRR